MKKQLKIQRKPRPKKREVRARKNIQLNEINFDDVYTLASYQCTRGEIYSILHISQVELGKDKAVKEEFEAAYEAGKEAGKSDLRVNQFELSKKNVVMSIFLGKQYLGQSDNPNSLAGQDLGTVKVEFVGSKEDDDQQKRLKEIEDKLKEEIK